MSRTAPPTPRPRRLSVLAVTVASVLTANAAVLATGAAADPEPDRGPDVAARVVALAATYPRFVPLDSPLEDHVVATVTLDWDETTATGPLPQPIRPPNPYAYEPEVRLGTLEIPKIGLQQPLFEGVTKSTINRGPGHWPGTAMPGQIGNVVVAGHRTTFTKPFWALNELVAGDVLAFTLADGSLHRYALDHIEIVRPWEIHIVDQTDARTATLFACHPRGSARYRIVARFTALPPTQDIMASDLPRLVPPGAG